MTFSYKFWLVAIVVVIAVGIFMGLWLGQNSKPAGDEAARDLTPEIQAIINNPDYDDEDIYIELRGLDIERIQAEDALKIN